jgi:hypothetical protein
VDLGLTEKERAGLKPGTYIEKHSQDWLCHGTTGQKRKRLAGGEAQRSTHLLNQTGNVVSTKFCIGGTVRREDPRVAATLGQPQIDAVRGRRLSGFLWNEVR